LLQETHWKGGIDLIERLIDLERPYGEPEYSKRSQQIAMLRQQLAGQLPPESQKWLDQLTDAYMRQETAVLRDAFADGFWTAVELMLEFYQKSGPRS